MGGNWGGDITITLLPLRYEARHLGLNEWLRCERQGEKRGPCKNTVETMPETVEL